MPFVARYHENSLSLNSQQVGFILEAAKENDIHVVIEYIEKAVGSLFFGTNDHKPEWQYCRCT